MMATTKEKYNVVAVSEDGFAAHLNNRPARIVRAMCGLPVA